MREPSDSEWRVLEGLLPAGWREAARDCKAFQRARYTTEPGSLLRLLLFHAVNDGGLRETTAQARASGIATMSSVALLKRLRTSERWLTWLGAELCRPLREEPHLPEGLRVRVVDSTTVQGPAATTTGWRIHYALDLMALSCDWYELTDATAAESLERSRSSTGTCCWRIGTTSERMASGISSTLGPVLAVRPLDPLRHAGQPGPRLPCAGACQKTARG